MGKFICGFVNRLVYTCWGFNRELSNL